MKWRPPEKPPFEEHQKFSASGEDSPWARIEYGARQTGRTHRMVQKALELNAKGRVVYILVHDDKYARDLRRTYNLPEVIKIETRRTLNVADIDWRNMRPSLGAWPNTALLVDHHYFEHFYGDMLREYHAYDFQEEP